MAKSVPPLWVPKRKDLISRVAHLVFSTIAEWDEDTGKRKITAPGTVVRRLASDLRALADLLEKEVPDATT